MAETGHAKNVENWQKMIAACTGFGGDYKPSNVNLTVGSMTRSSEEKGSLILAQHNYQIVLAEGDLFGLVWI